MKNYLILFLFCSININAQIKVYLNNLTKLEDNGLHFEITSAKPKEDLVLPKVSDVEISYSIKYLNLLCNPDTGDDRNISVLLYQLKNEDLLYIDRNNDNDLTNDGDPILFPLNKDSITFELNASPDKNQKLKYALFRKPDLPDSLLSTVVDDEGNLKDIFLKPARTVFSEDPDYEGKKRTFYFDYRMTLKKGKLKLDSLSYQVGVYDYLNNGIYNDNLDLFIIDLDNSGKINLDKPSNVFSLNDIFTIGGKNYKITEVDKNGDYVILYQTDEKPTTHYLEWKQKISYTDKQENKLTSEFWESSLVTLDGKKIDLSGYKGKYLFINIWGEWCKPCIDEVEELKQAFSKNKDQVNFLGIIKVNDLNKAKEVISKKGIVWENTFISDELIKALSINGYPTNILIYPDGTSYVRAHQINRTFFDMYVK